MRINPKEWGETGASSEERATLTGAWHTFWAALMCLILGHEESYLGGRLIGPASGVECDRCMGSWGRKNAAK